MYVYWCMISLYVCTYISMYVWMFSMYVCMHVQYVCSLYIVCYVCGIFVPEYLYSKGCSQAQVGQDMNLMKPLPVDRRQWYSDRRADMVSLVVRAGVSPAVPHPHPHSPADLQPGGAGGGGVPGCVYITTMTARLSNCKSTQTTLLWLTPAPESFVMTWHKPVRLSNVILVWLIIDYFSEEVGGLAS